MDLEEDLAGSLAINQAYAIRCVNGGPYQILPPIEFIDIVNDNDTFDNQQDNQIQAIERSIPPRRWIYTITKARQEAQRNQIKSIPEDSDYSTGSDSEPEEPEELTEIEKAYQADPEWWERVKKNTEAFMAKRTNAIMHCATETKAA
ncbi:hypothetical protein M378DRAFT_180441 [Amanita muscaria Koide BX008]|uniref:Uncharacterized protein n=1 Tax=Amanita muscaria (strain Koide BX008) TaxID=946122 RepID=A0A0C2T1R7_AMAMK|nr:hypothetical protein M378DRAFT_180441 [Amanita muscaria Koide BX008]